MPDKKDEQPETPTPTENHHHDHNFMIVMGVAALVIALLIGVGIGGWRHNREVSRGAPFAFGKIETRGMDGRGMGGFGGEVNSSNRVSGTVTAVNGSSFTVAGFGSTTNVQTNSSTQYRDGNTVKVNDTVTAFGTTSNGTLTATLVAINE